MSRGRTANMRAIGVASAAVAASLALTACGDGDRNYNKGFRPPLTLNLGLTLEPGKAYISPTEIGGGPAQIKISNQTDTEVLDVRLRSPYGDGGCVSAEAGSGPIPPRGSGTVDADLIEGTCEVVADGIGTVRFVVSGERPSSQNRLLLP